MKTFVSSSFPVIGIIALDRVPEVESHTAQQKNGWVPPFVFTNTGPQPTLKWEPVWKRKETVLQRAFMCISLITTSEVDLLPSFCKCAFYIFCLFIFWGLTYSLGLGIWLNMHK